jgi:hypothetical protein
MGRGAFLWGCNASQAILYADVRGLHPDFTYQWVLSDGDNFMRFTPVTAMSPDVVQVVDVGEEAADGLSPVQSEDDQRLQVHWVMFAPLRSSFIRPLLVVVGETAEPGLGWVVAAPNDVADLLRQKPCP